MWLTALVALSTAIRIALGRLIVAPWIMVDELVYSELAKSVADEGRLLVRGVPTTGYGVLYPALLAPAWRAFDAVPDAYAAAKAINAVVMSLAAVPAYALARRLVAPGAALAAAALAVAVPSLLYTGTLMTENLFYPLFLVVALALVRTLERPTLARQAVLVALCALAFAARAQAVALLAAVALAPLALAALERRRRALRSFAPLYGLLAALSLAAIAVAAVRGRPLLESLGAYRAALHSGYSAGAVLRYLLYHVAELDLYLGVVPFAALLVMWIGWRAAPAFAAASLALVVCTVAVVAAFASQPSVARVQERNLFYVAPLALIALVAGVRAGRRTTIGAAALAAALPAFLPYGRLFSGEAVADTLAVLPWWSAHDRFLPLAAVRWTALAASLAAGALFVAALGRSWLLLALPVGAYFVLVTAVAAVGAHGMRSASLAARDAGLDGADPAWVDRSVGEDGTVADLWTGIPAPYAVWETELFNRSIGPVYDLRDPLPGHLPETRVSRRVDGVLVAAGRPVRARYALADGSVELAGDRLATQAGLTLYRVGGPLVSLTEIRGVYPDNWSGPTVTYTRVRCTAGRLSVLLRNDPALFARQVVTATVKGRRVGHVELTRDDARLVVPLRPDARRICRVRFDVASTAVPAQVLDHSSDTRRLGVHVLRFERVGA
jgi:hypothetical protein